MRHVAQPPQQDYGADEIQSAARSTTGTASQLQDVNHHTRWPEELIVVVVPFGTGGEGAIYGQ